MSGTTAFVGFAIAALVLISVWIWLNVTLIRRMHTKELQVVSVSSPVDGVREVSTNETSERASRTLPNTSPGPVDADMVVRDAPQDTRHSHTEMTPDDAPGTQSHSDDPVHNSEVYVLGASEEHTVSNRKQVPFYVSYTPDSPFVSAEWMTSLQGLSQDSNILGWVAFHGNTVGASDRRYDDTLTEVLRSYRSMLERLRKEVGLTQVLESSIVGAEGKIWVVSRGDDIWFVLFLDNTVNAQDIAEELLTLGMSAST